VPVDPGALVAEIHQRQSLGMDKTSSQTIHDFGKQWKRYTENKGYYASAELFKDYCGPLLSREDVKGKRVLEIGSGTGRIVNMLIGLGKVYAVEPSEAWCIESQYQSDREKVTCLKVSGKKSRYQSDLRSVWVLHLYQAKTGGGSGLSSSKKGGKFIIWLDMTMNLTFLFSSQFENHKVSPIFYGLLTTF
jgi:hypothetical protein